MPLPKGFKHSEETKRKIGLYGKGKRPFLGRKHTEESKNKIRASCLKAFDNDFERDRRSKRSKGKKLNYSISGENNPMFGKRHSDDTKNKIRIKAVGRKLELETKLKISKRLKGVLALDKHPMWKGGVSFQPYSIEWNEGLRRLIRERDKYTCMNCGIAQGNKAHSVHHIDYDKNNCNHSNLITLCCSCHSRTNNKDRLKWIQIFQSKINECIRA